MKAFHIKTKTQLFMNSACITNRRMKHPFPALIVILLLTLACGTSQAAVPANTANTTTGLDSYQVRWEYSTGSEAALSVAADTTGRPDLYVAALNGGLLVLDISNPAAPAQAAVIPAAQFGGLAVTFVTQNGNDLYLALGNFFDAHGAKAGLAIVNIEDPRHPKVLSIWTADAVARGASSVLVDGSYAYLAAMSDGVDIFDISDPARIQRVASILPDVDFPRQNPDPVSHPNARGLALDGNRLFVAYDAGGLRVIDVNDKQNPREITKYINPGMGNKNQAYNNILLNPPYAYVAVDYCGLEILDIRNPEAIQQVGWWNPWRCDSPSNLWLNSPGQTNQLALDPVDQVVYLSSGNSELQAVDVADPGQPQRIGAFGSPKDDLGAWGVARSNNTIYLTYIQSLVPFKSKWAGIKALAIP